MRMARHRCPAHARQCASEGCEFTSTRAPGQCGSRSRSRGSGSRCRPRRWSRGPGPGTAQQVHAKEVCKPASMPVMNSSKSAQMGLCQDLHCSNAQCGARLLRPPRHRTPQHCPPVIRASKRACMHGKARCRAGGSKSRAAPLQLIHSGCVSWPRLATMVTLCLRCRAACTHQRSGATDDLALRVVLRAVAWALELVLSLHTARVRGMQVRQCDDYMH